MNDLKIARIGEVSIAPDATGWVRGSRVFFWCTTCEPPHRWTREAYRDFPWKLTMKEQVMPLLEMKINEDRWRVVQSEKFGPHLTIGRDSGFDYHVEFCDE